MDPQAILVAVAVVGGVGLAFGALIALANARFHVEEDPRIARVVDMLPGTNCGACGFAGCGGLAEGLVAGEAQPARCTVMADDEREDVARFLGVDAGEADRRVARLLCAGDRDAAMQYAEYLGHSTCGAAAAVASGGKACSWGCLGIGDCEVACTFGAISMNAGRLPVVDPARCTACGDCVDACPKDLFTILPEDQHLLVQCKSELEGDAAETLCRVACTGCGKCALDAPAGVIEIRRGLARIDPDLWEQATPAATSRCPTGAIVWVEGAQFASGRTKSDRAAAPRALAASEKDAR